MADVFSKEQRSKVMARVSGKDTKPEMKLRRLLHGIGFRYRLHRKDLPGKPDLVLAKYKAVIFVHGCFWHRHSGCKHATTPSSNVEYWARKFERNVERDQRVQQELRELGWRVTVVWACELKHMNAMAIRLIRFLGDGYFDFED